MSLTGLAAPAGRAGCGKGAGRATAGAGTANGLADGVVETASSGAGAGAVVSAACCAGGGDVAGATVSTGGGAAAPASLSPAILRSTPTPMPSTTTAAAEAAIIAPVLRLPVGAGVCVVGAPVAAICRVLAEFLKVGFGPVRSATA